jgi:hypothetical protein
VQEGIKESFLFSRQIKIVDKNSLAYVGDDVKMIQKERFYEYHRGIKH